MHFFGVPFNPDEVAGLENFFGCGLQDAPARLIAGDGFGNIGMPFGEVAVGEVNEMAKRCEIAVLHCCRNRCCFDCLVRIHLKCLMQLTLGVELLACTLATPVRRTTGIVEAVILGCQVALSVVAKIHG